ncbi:hypothetical protein Q5424_23475 [Conexibacter sp. JD483]|uniref:hypothetical protein n=1 Tax=unclassified Conexibacter TaxID=2627773 RepID=UPI002727FFBB|nr:MULTISPECIES: hypothetical protein [unclassified Conexibacter]MDO8185673.1 hypothetical protein [Conexibacter sp. CPCC 205706]MDO8198846.1 hypothetical protein [Conexibacter sp. CPCC 205762]MDR9372079.1 hypothetical protein [Conexibacter sp. JD483]
MERAISDDLAGRESRYPDRVAFIDANEHHAGREIARALDHGYAVALTSPDGRERLVANQTRGATPCGS